MWIFFFFFFFWGGVICFDLNHILNVRSIRIFKLSMSVSFFNFKTTLWNYNSITIIQQHMIILQYSRTSPWLPRNNKVDSDFSRVDSTNHWFLYIDSAFQTQMTTILQKPEKMQLDVEVSPPAFNQGCPSWKCLEQILIFLEQLGYLHGA